MLDTNEYRTSYLFFMPDEKALAHHIGLDRHTLCHPDYVIDSFIAFLDTPNKDFEKNQIDLIKINYNSQSGVNFSGIDKHMYSTDNVWQTQSQRLIGWDTSVNDQKLVEDPSLKSALRLQGMPIKIKYGERGIDCDKTDIGIYWENWPEINLTHIRFFSPNAGSMHNGRHVIDAHGDPALDPKQVEREYNESNYAKMLFFIDNLFDKGLITPVTEMPCVMARRISRFG